ncbi:MAG: helix-turn-helix domain-containing protein, partial [Mycobacteriales bacterium]|nr:helix-turn-helix domain-containing protein [Mycobacteriales bacterium]
MTAAADSLVMSQGQRESLEKVAKSETAAHREVLRARVLLAAADGVANSAIASEQGVTPVTVRSWRRSFEAD